MIAMGNVGDMGGQIIKILIYLMVKIESCQTKEGLT